jgi:hypothetical protein
MAASTTDHASKSGACGLATAGEHVVAGGAVTTGDGSGVAGDSSEVLEAGVENEGSDGVAIAGDGSGVRAAGVENEGSGGVGIGVLTVGNPASFQACKPPARW